MTALAIPETGEAGVTATATRPRLPSGKERALACAQLAADSRGKEVVVLETKGFIAWVDYLVLATGTSTRQLRAMADEIEEAMEALGDRPTSVEGKEGGKWVLLDFGDVIVHLFDADCREYYQLDSLWGDAPRTEVLPTPRPEGESAPAAEFPPIAGPALALARIDDGEGDEGEDA